MRFSGSDHERVVEDAFVIEEGLIEVYLRPMRGYASRVEVYPARWSKSPTLWVFKVFAPPKRKKVKS